ncbi:MAG: translation initiation factor IF-2 [Candidatus Nealsonbacteria bacterium]|nr:translation initiation factor IF-2 [Candidatus Nealsonbacteria bacterium]
MAINKSQNLLFRSPAVVVLGHVDHGKSSLLEAVKDFKITEKESGGITQHIGAYEVDHQGKRITFIDTPGHEAFSLMRSRGASVADIAILVVAADEGVKPQTKEAISHIKKAGIPLIVAINKIDKPQALPEKVKGELAKNEILVESMGGKVPSVEVSAKTKKGIQELLDLILLVAEMEEFKWNKETPGQGVVIESYLDQRRGPTATVILRDGVLKNGDIIATRSTLGKTKILEDFQGNSINYGIPSMPIVVLGWEEVPQVGEKFEVYPNTEEAQKYIEKKERKKDEGAVMFLEEGKRVLNLVLKADVKGSLEAIEGMLKTFPQDRVILRIINGDVGDVTEGDIKLADSSKARIIGFRISSSLAMKKFAERQEVQIIIFDVIYDLAQAVKTLMEKVSESEKIRVDIGKLKTLIVFKTDKNRQIIGGRVIEGEIKKSVLIEVSRNEEVLGRGKLVSLQKEKKDIEKAKKGEEVGILYEGDIRIEEGDILVIYIEEKRKIKI